MYATRRGPASRQPKVDTKPEYFVNLAHVLIEGGIPMEVAL